MLRKALVVAILGIAILVPGLATQAQTEEPSPNGLQKLSNSMNKFGKDVNQFGKNLVGLVKPKGKAEERAPASGPQDYQEPPSGRSGSVLTRYRSSRDSNQETALPAKTITDQDRARQEEGLSDRWPYQSTESSQAEPSQAKTTPPSKMRLFESDEKSSAEASDSRNTPSTTTTITKPSNTKAIQTPKTPRTRTSSSRYQPTSTKPKSAQPRSSQSLLHQRLRVLKSSPFETSYENEEARSKVEAKNKPTLHVEPTEAEAIEPSRQETETTPRSTSPGIRFQPFENKFKPRLKQPSAQPSSMRNNPTRRKTSGAGQTAPRHRVTAIPTHTAGVQPATALPKGQLLLSRDCPVLNVQTTGPAKINIGREAKYTVILENQAEVTANEVLVTVELPEWVDVIGSNAEQGTAAVDRSTTSRRLCWRLETLPGKARYEMTLRLIPRKRRPIELAVRSSFTQVASQATIEVQEPQLAMRLIGPKQVQLGKAVLFKLEVTNSGNGSAEAMVLTLLPLTKQGMPTTHQLGNLDAGAKRTLDLELTAQQLKDVSVEADLKCNASAGAKLIEKLTVLAPEVKAGVFGPAVRFLGTHGSYQIKVANFGNLEAKAIQIQAIVPQEAQFIKGSKGVKFEKRSSTATWKLASLKPGEERTLNIECEMVNQGTARLVVNVNDGRYTELSKVASIRIESMADLAMKVVDPQGPVSIGEEAVYEIHIRNRGTRPAEAVSAVAYFSEGVEPVSASGMKHRIVPGQVAFQTIGSIPPNDVVVLKVRAVAGTSGNHMFRAELECTSLGTKLIGEETTHFYRGARLAGDGQLGPDSGEEQTVDRRNEPTLAPQRTDPFRR